MSLIESTSIKNAFDTLFSFENPFKDLFGLVVINGDKSNVLQLSKVKNVNTCP